MPQVISWNTALLIGLSLTAMYTDARWRRVPNMLTLPLVLIGWCGALVTDGWPGLAQSLVGFMVGLGVLFIPWLMGGMGGGDVKFLAAAGALSNWVFILRASLIGALLGGAMALVVVLLRDRTRVANWFMLRSAGVETADGPVEPGKIVLPYAVALGGGVLLMLLASSKGWW